MAPDDTSGARPAPVVLRIKLRYDDVETLVQRFAPNVGKSGLFLPTKALHPAGTEVKFEVRLGNDEPVLVGLGRVKAAQEADPANPRAVFGIALELMRVTPQSRTLILRILERRRALGLPELGLPMPADVEAARRAAEVDPSVRDFATGPVATLEPHADLLTAPRRQTGPIGTAKLHTITPLGPEPPRRKRPAISEVIESASGPVAVATSGLEDEPVDLGAVLARARVLTGANGGGLDAELDALLEAQAAPIEIGIEAASAELARQLGGQAVSRRAKDAASPETAPRWAPPPPVEPAAPEPAPVRSFGPPDVEIATPVDPSSPGPHRSPLFEDEDDALAELEQDAATVGPSSEVTQHEHEVAPDQIADEIHQLGEDDLEDVEHTMIGAAPGEPADPNAFDHHACLTEPSAADNELRAPPLDDQLAEAEAEAAIDNLGLSEPLPQDEDEIEAMEIDDFEILAEADEDDEDLLAAHGEQDASAVPAHDELPPERPSVSDFAARLDLGEDSVSDFYPGPPAAPPEPSLGDTLAALDDEPSYTPLPRQGVVRPVFEPEPSNSYTMPGALDDGHDEFDEPHSGFRMQHSFDQSDVIDIRNTLPAKPAKPARAEPAYLASTPRGADDEELESALEALDVDLDDLAMPHAATQLQRDRSRNEPAPIIRAGKPSRAPQTSPSRQPQPGRPGLPRATTEDGVLIDFDDED